MKNLKTIEKRLGKTIKMRKAIVSGEFYLSDKSGLNKQIESCFFNKFGPGSLPRAFNLKQKKIALISPHAGYQYSGPCAAHGYKAFMEVSKKDLAEIFIIIGPNHSGYGKVPFALSFENFETPLGLVKNDTELGEKFIEEASSFGVQKDELAHKFEHSIEVQLPFLQFCYGLIKKDFKIVPLVIATGDYEKCIKVSRAIANALQEMEKEKKVCVIASSDFTHYGYGYGFVPFIENIKQNLYEWDKKSINYILKLDSKGFYQEAIKTTICGTAPIIITIEIAKALGAKKASLLKYYTSGDLLNNYKNAVSYASIVIE
ncbi:MAG: AmmeMemoRadiSam system protein B [Candidatus Pacearchaeota archaeon]|nr:AmmeMemoRadiSam system protein B [Candidatus Pacearchaeota archaeon]